MGVTKVTWLLLGLSACIVGEDASNDVVALDRKKEGTDLERVVLGRLYQNGHWMLPAADTYGADHTADTIDRRIAYVCDALVKLEPTYVSGLIRLAWDDVVTDDMKRIFNGVRQCVRSQVDHPVKFDVVLNAKHFSEPRSSADNPANGVSSKQEGSDRIKERLRTATRELAPDIWFFDFYTVPFNQTSESYFPGAIRDGIDWIHHDGKKVGGNAWGNNVPDDTDLIAVPLIGGFEGRTDEIAKLQAQAPTLVHIRNDPQVCDSEGLERFRYLPDRRKSVLENHASKQADLNVGYMYPLFFPLSATAECAPPNTPQVAYDAVADGALQTIRDSLDRHAYRPRVR